MASAPARDGGGAANALRGDHASLSLLAPGVRHRRNHHRLTWRMVSLTGSVVLLLSISVLILPRSSLEEMKAENNPSKKIYIDLSMALALNVTGKYTLRDPKYCDKTIGTISNDQCWIYFPGSCATDDNNRVCHLTLPGHKGLSMPNQDQSVALQLGPTTQLLALFDGHGTLGHAVAHAALQLLPLHVLHHRSELSSHRINSKQNFQNAWKDAFLQVDARPAIRRVSHAGTTAIVVLQSGQDLVMASVGDSTAFIVGSNGTILIETVHHKPALPTERHRIESLGGTVYIPNPNLVSSYGESSRVLLPGPLGPDTYALAMSRSLGDNEGKVLGYLLAEPDVQVLDVSDPSFETGGFVVVASDGLLDAISAPELARTLHQAIHANTMKQTCHDLLKQAADHWDRTSQHTYRDDITLLVAKLLV